MFVNFEKQQIASTWLYFYYKQGCDASILLDSTDGNPSEKESPPNLTVEGYDLIDKIKTRLEDMCNATVSCADIVALAARDAVTFPVSEHYIQIY